jgi:hypothetical protein
MASPGRSSLIRKAKIAANSAAASTSSAERRAAERTERVIASLSTRAHLRLYVTRQIGNRRSAGPA